MTAVRKDCGLKKPGNHETFKHHRTRVSSLQLQQGFSIWGDCGGCEAVTFGTCWPTTAVGVLHRVLARAVTFGTARSPVQSLSCAARCSTSATHGPSVRSVG